MNFPRSSKAIWRIFLLVVALLWAPIWGHWHSVEHGAAHAVLHAHSVSADAHNTHDHGDVDEDVLTEQGTDPLGHEAGSDLCQVLDHLVNADRLIASNAAGLSLPVAGQAPIFHAHLFLDHDRWSQPQARAPPELI